MVLAPAPPRSPEGSGSRPASDQGNAGTTTALRAILTVLVTLLLGALLEAEALRETANAQPFGWRRTALLALADPLADISKTLGFDRPRRWLDDLIHEPGPEPSPLPTSPSPSPSPSPTAPGPTPTPTAPPRRVPTTASPLRIWIGGDSMTQAMGESLIQDAADSGVARAKLEVRYSSGLTRPDFYDWPGRLRALVDAARPPEAIVVVFGANDAQGIRTARGPEPFATAAWRAEYASRVAATMQTLSAGGRTVYWVGQPIMRSSSFSARMRILDSIYRAEAERHGVRYIDTWRLFADAQGHYSAYLRDDRGRRVLMRTPDGIHLTRAGGDRLAQAVLAVMAADWELGLR